MTIRQLIGHLTKAARQIGGDSDVTVAFRDNFMDITSATVVTQANCPENLKWCCSGEVVLIEFARD